MKRMAMLFALVALCASAAVAQIDVDLAFDPTEAAPGDEVGIFMAIANLGDEAVVAEIELYATYNEYEFGPLTGNLPLAAGEEMSKEMVFIVPFVPESGDLVISVTATAGEYSDTAEAVLTIIVEEGGGESFENLPHFLLDELVGDGTEAIFSFSSVKLLY